MISDTGISEKVQNEICKYAKEHNVDQVILFGSRARGDFKRVSDIDLAVKGGNEMMFAFDVDEKTSTLLHYDIVNLNEPMQEELRDSIMREGRVLYEKI